MYNYNEEDDNNQYYEELNQNELSLHQSQELHQEIEHEVEQEANI